MTSTSVEPKTSPPEPERHWKDFFGFSTDHKVIGIQYFVTSFFFYLVAGLMATSIRLELATPEPDFLGAENYNGVLTLHGTMMIFLWIVPTGAAFANYLIPLMIGAKDMAFPVLNGIAFWLVPPGGVLLLTSLVINQPPVAGWTSYPPPESRQWRGR